MESSMAGPFFGEMRLDENQSEHADMAAAVGLATSNPVITALHEIPFVHIMDKYLHHTNKYGQDTEHES
jgi:hypothetical protein